MGARTDHHRKSVRLPGYDYGQAGAYFVTIVTDQRTCLFGQIIEDQMRLSEAGRIVQACWLAIPKHFSHAELGAFVVMPNHVHGIIILHDRAAVEPPPVGATRWVAPTTPDAERRQPKGPSRGSIGAIVGAYKMAVTRQIVQTLGGAPNIWQRNYHEHIIRNERDHRNVHDYILVNPLNWRTDDENQG
jgi:putative transposase